MNDKTTALLPGAKERKTRAVSEVYDDGTLLELAYDPIAKRTTFIVWDGKAWKRVESYRHTDGRTLHPYRATNNLIANNVVLLPSEPLEYGGEQSLIAEIRAFIHRYCDVSERFEQIAAYYVLLSWVHDSFNELPYLRLRGDYGSGKTRFLLTAGSLCYKPIFASGASTVSPIFHILDAFGGTLILDEGDFRMSDEKADMVKILNNGNVKGIPVLRTEVSRDGEFNPRAFKVFGPKIVATRGFFHDRALESRFLTEEMGTRRLRDDVPINLDALYRTEALQLRNKLLLFRFHHFGKKHINAGLVDPTIEPRLNQVFVPLMSIVTDEALQRELKVAAREYNRDIIADRSLDVEAQVLEIIRTLSQNPDGKRIAVKDVTVAFIEKHQHDYDRQITAKWIGGVMRRNLQINTLKSNGVFCIPPTETRRLERLYEKYGVDGGNA